MQIGKISLLAVTLIFATSAAYALTPIEREKTRFHLANAFNEAELLIKNHNSFERDVKRQEQDFKGMKVFERIPLTDNLQDLREQLEESAKPASIEISAYQIGKRTPVDLHSIPQEIYSSDEFRIPEAKLVEKIPLNLQIRGDEKRIDNWVKNWDDEILRLIEPNGKLVKISKNEFKISARTYRFTEATYPTLKAKDPILFLPKWARDNPKKFAAQEPTLWDYVKKARDLYPESSRYLKFRQQYLMNDARISFYLAKTVKPRTMKE